MKKKLILIAAMSLCAIASAKGHGGGGSHYGSHGSSSHGGSHSSHAGTSSIGSSHSVSGYTRKDGTYVAPSHATNPNQTAHDNWTTKGNTNPYTGKDGTREP
ncbi:hypothetical protein [Paracidovorax wautersii]|uniref:Uncharacterized protein n=1 Tax=Paracidovorax wautersii TaxID=1177982 RepID=A0A1I2AXV5_9BURK|nr:hypothetical protein [Paracidovorax wautersii]SFE47823.1 hypothetical protein SAMN04489711_102247 [Paracidovorax wautersii]